MAANKQLKLTVAKANPSGVFHSDVSKVATFNFIALFHRLQVAFNFMIQQVLVSV